MKEIKTELDKMLWIAYMQIKRRGNGDFVSNGDECDCIEFIEWYEKYTK